MSETDLDRVAYDYVIVGAGSAGCVLAARLSQDPDTRVLLIEAGPADRSPFISIPFGFGKLMRDRLFDWRYLSEPEAALGGRRLELPRGKVVGGSSSINAMAYDRGHRRDFDGWRASGATGWDFADVLPYFKRAETWQEGQSANRGGDGPLQVQKTGRYDPLYPAYLEASKAAGHPVMDDYNVPDRLGFAPMQSTIANGRRCSTAVAYLRPALRRPNLSMRTRTQVTRVLIERDRAIGVEYAQGSALRVAYAAREVILSGGTFNSPQMLMLSGIGEADHLRRVGAPVVLDLPGVGRNLQDHVQTYIRHARNGSGPVRQQLRLDRLVFSMAQAWLTGRGPASDLPSGFMGYAKTSPQLDAPDIQFLFRGLPPEAGAWLPGVGPPWADGFLFRPVLLYPESRGSVRLASADPAAPAVIRQNFLSKPDDLRRLREGLRLAREVTRQAPLDPFRGEELSPGPDITAQDEIDAYIRRTAASTHHPVGTCAMGTGPEAVVDGRLRVHGVEGLRIVDASVIPFQIGANTNAATIMIAEKAADLIRGNEPLSTVREPASRKRRRGIAHSSP